MFSCKKATELIEKKQAFRLTRMESLKMHLHLTLCASCKAYERQSEFIHQWLSEESHAKIDLPPDLKEKIIDRLANLS